MLLKCCLPLVLGHFGMQDEICCLEIICFDLYIFQKDLQVTMEHSLLQSLISSPPFSIFIY